MELKLLKGRKIRLKYVLSGERGREGMIGKRIESVALVDC